MDELTDKIEQLEEEIKSMKLMEKQMRAALIKTENAESELSAQLENAQGDVEVGQGEVKLNNESSRKVSQVVN